MKAWPTFRKALEDLFEQKKALDPTYSLRRFAFDIGLTPSHLSDVLSKRRGLSSAKAVEIAERLSLKDFDRQDFIDLVEKEGARSAHDRELAAVRLNRRHGLGNATISEDQSEFLADWITPALFEMISTTKGVVKLTDFARRFGVDLQATRKSFDVLKRLGFLKESNEIFERTRDYSHVVSAHSNKLLRAFHKQILELVAKRLDETDALTRENISSVISFDHSKTAEARDFIAEFHSEFIQRFSSKTDADTVYVFTQHFVRADFRP